MPSGKDVGAAGAADGETERVVDPAARDLLVAREPGEDRQAGGVGGRPAGGPEPVRAQVPDRAGAGAPAAVRARREREELVELAAVAVDDQRVPVAVGVAAALDRDVRRNRVRTGVGLVGILERDARPRLRGADDGDRDPDRPALVEPGAEVGVEVVVEPDRRDDPFGVSRDGQAIDALVPRVRGREDGTRGRLGKPRSRRCATEGEQADSEQEHAAHERQDAAGGLSLAVRSYSGGSVTGG